MSVRELNFKKIIFIVNHKFITGGLTAPHQPVVTQLRIPMQAAITAKEFSKEKMLVSSYYWSANPTWDVENSVVTCTKSWRCDTYDSKNIRYTPAVSFATAA